MLLCAVDVCFADATGGARPSHCDLDGCGGVEGDEFEYVGVGDVVEPGDELPVDGVAHDALTPDSHGSLALCGELSHPVGLRCGEQSTPSASATMRSPRWISTPSPT